MPINSSGRFQNVLNTVEVVPLMTKHEKEISCVMNVEHYPTPSVLVKEKPFFQRFDVIHLFILTLVALNGFIKKRFKLVHPVELESRPLEQ